MNVTTHAIERYQQRIRPDLTLKEAESLLKANALKATRIKGNTKYGQLRYDGGDCTLIVKETADAGLMVVSIYPSHGRDPSTVLKWDGTLSKAAVELNALIDSVCMPVETTGDFVAPVSVERAPKPKDRAVGDMRTARENALEGAERAIDRVKEAEKHMRAQIEAARREANNAQKDVVKAREHATLKHQESENNRALAIDLIRALPEDMAREVAERHGEAGKWALVKALRKSS